MIALYTDVLVVEVSKYKLIVFISWNWCYKSNEIIKLKIKEMNLTQVQMAEYLGVTTTVVNKWENVKYRMDRNL